jgi:hypothetical protein
MTQIDDNRQVKLSGRVISVSPISIVLLAAVLALPLIAC